MSVELVEQFTRQLRELAERDEKELRKQLKGYGAGWGLHRLTDAQHAIWFEREMGKWPPVPLVMPDGAVMVASPWLLAMAIAEDGDAEIQRYLRTRQRAVEEAVEGEVE